jgi:hypothetical protein
MIPFSGVRRTASPVRVTRLLTAVVTAAGQSIVLCLNPATIAVSIYEIAAGATLREHKHPFVRYPYVLTGTLRVTNTETGDTAMIIDAADLNPSSAKLLIGSIIPRAIGWVSTLSVHLHEWIDSARRT